MVTRVGPIDDEIPCSATDSGMGFGPFRLDVQRQILRRDNERVVLGSRAYAILCALLERPGELVSKAELFKRAWPNISVDEANLRVQVAVLRKALGEHGANLIAVAGLGYQLNMAVTARSTGVPSGSPRFHAPVASDEPLGREEDIASIGRHFEGRRLVTIVGPGGIGKTTLALAVAKELAGTLRHGVCFVDLGILSDSRLVTAALATALQQRVSTGDPLAAVLMYLRPRELLIILDCCEHVIEVVALIAEQVLAQAPDVRILVTSRESLRVTSEVVEELGGLQTPLWNDMLTAAEALNFSAIQLFARSAASRTKEFKITDENIALTSEICRRLDGIPLAIELAAALNGLLGLAAVRDSLDQRFAVLTLGRRTSLPRQRTLAATMAWSYDLLSDNERAVLRRLSTFAGQFTMEAAIVVSSDDYIDEVEATRCIIDLAGKSLLSIDRRHMSPRYRLLETTRVYARQQIAPSEERGKAALRHARYYLALLEAMDWEIYDPKRSRGSIAEYVEEVRGAIDWAYASGASDLAIDLTLAAERPWLELGLIAVIIQRMQQALDGLDASGITPDRRQRMKVLTALGTANVYAFSLDQSPLLFQNALLLANELNDRTYQMRTLWGLFHYHMMSRMPSKALEFARHFERLAAENPEHPDSLLADHQIGWCLLELGELTTSKEHVERFLTRYTSPHRSHSVLFASDKRMSAQVFLGDLHWLQGSPERGLAVVEAALAEAEKLQHPPSGFYALAYGTCFVALFSWNLLAARRHLQALESVVLQYKPWAMIALAYRGMLARQEGDLPLARRYLEEAMATGSPVRTAGLYPLLLVELADVRRMTGDLDGAEHAADLAHKCQRGPLDVAINCTALRAKAEIMADRRIESCHKQAEALFEQSINLSRRQGALTLELASAVGLSRYWASRGRAQEAHSLLKGVVDQITEGHDLPPMIEARALIESLEGSVELS